ncbi:DUF3304 domain-containing protein [Aquitalea pelogenes]|uniref:DUF3304 domain-containing protein n=1 Tax=Aquitalea pelogenes TaxID=1293573 RepID=UPI000786F45D|nr:DUF3304 domain-containing protein [Aquitalea pelogenes]
MSESTINLEHAQLAAPWDEQLDAFPSDAQELRNTRYVQQQLWRHGIRWLKRALLCLLLPWLAACSSLAGPGGGLIGVPTHLYDFNPHIYTVKSVTFEFLGVAGVSGGEVCCATLPRTWRPGLMATVRWVEDPNPCLGCAPNMDKERSKFLEYVKKKEASYQHYSAQVEIPQYGSTCGLNLVFLPCHQVRLVLDCQQKYPLIKQWRAEAKQLEGQSCPKAQ